MKPRIITPATQVIELARGKLQCKIAGNDRDTDVADAIEAARSAVEAELGVPVGDQVREYTYATWCGSVTLPCDVTELQAVTAAGVPVDPLPTVVGGRILTFTATAPVVIRIRCGWTAQTIPGTVKMAMLLLIADYVRNPQAHVENQLFRNGALDGLLWPERERHPL